MNDTIFAPSSAIGGAIAVIRISGDHAVRAMALFDRDLTNVPQRLVYVRALDCGEVVDDCMAVWFPAPKTYTGEDMLEINCHGGMQTVRKILEMLGGIGFRPAQGGEFTKRAFLNGKMDLTQAEAVMDIITADAEQSRKAAMLQLHGSVSREVEAVEQLLLDALSGIDAAIDYPDEAEEDAYAAVPETLRNAIERMEKLIADGRRGRVLRDGLRVAILGRPNVGKSSLMNTLLGHDRAIVTANAGTTRDVLDEKVSFDGVPIRLIDTAGLRETEDEAERIGVDRAREAMRTADVRCVVFDGSTALTDDDAALLQETSGEVHRIILINKCDLPTPWTVETLTAERVEQGQICRVSAKTGAGLDTLKQRILEMAAPEQQDCTCITNERHMHLLEQALQALCSATESGELDCLATDIQNALHYLGAITGTDVDAAVIERIFERFCVGK
ncbi:MAG: tRNA uridine-5-carboxymethylaminomethyl(34) synthesis GTPase MnmE [Clostridia bacterium]